MSFKVYLILFLLGLGYVIYLFLIYLKTKVPYVVTPKKYFPKLITELNINPETVIYDLGSGKGDFLFAAEKAQPKKLVGYELSPIHVWLSKIRGKLKKSSAEFYCQDFMKVDISEADIVYLFLVKSVINKVWSKLKQEAKLGCQIVVLGEKLPELKPSKIIQNKVNVHSYYYIYQKED